jgi:hypothetical protein
MQSPTNLRDYAILSSLKILVSIKIRSQHWYSRINDTVDYFLFYLVFPSFNFLNIKIPLTSFIFILLSPQKQLPSIVSKVLCGTS